MMDIRFQKDKISISAADITDLNHEIEKVYLNQFKKGKIESMIDPRDKNVWQIDILARDK